MATPNGSSRKEKKKKISNETGINWLCFWTFKANSKLLSLFFISVILTFVSKQSSTFKLLQRTACLMVVFLFSSCGYPT